MNIEANLKKLKTSIKRRKKITLTLMLGFLMTGVIGYADPTVEELQQKIQELQNKIDQIEGKIGRIGDPDGKIRGIAIGQEATIDSQGGNDEDYSLAIGRKARVGSNGLDFSSIALGDNAYVLNGSGKQEKVLSFMDDNYNGEEPKDKTKVPGGISIGTNTFARTGSIQIGSHTYSGLMGGIDVNDKTNGEANIVNMTTIGTNSYQKAAMGTMVGAYNISTGGFTGAGGFNSFSYGAQNFGSSVFGTLNSIRSKGKGGNSGVANSIIGIANTTENANGSLVFGAGNVIKNSNEYLSLTNTVTGSFKNVDEAVEKFQKAIKNNKSGGATLAIGGGNTADYTKQVTMIGTNNTVKGDKDKKVELNMVAGDDNKIENSSRNIVYGNKFRVGVAKQTRDNEPTPDVNGNLLFGFNTKENVVNNKNVVALGNDIKVTEDNAVYLGNESSSNIKEENDNNAKTIWQQQIVKIKQDIYSDKVETEGVKGLKDKIREKEGKKHTASFFNPLTDEQKAENNRIDEEIKALNNDIQKLKDENINKTMKEKYKDYSEYAGFTQMGSILSVGNSNFTRVIQNVAPGLISATSTDAINGSQLFNYVAKQYITVKDGKGNSTQVKLGDTLTLKGTTVDVTVKAPEPAQSTPVTPTPAVPTPAAPQPTPAPAKPTETKAPEHTATFEVKGNVGGSDTFGYKYRDDKGKETELKEGPDGKLYTQDFLDKNEYKNNKWVKKGSTEDSILKDNQYDKKDEKVILSTKYGKIITDVANGVKDNDAVNVSQLKAVSTRVEKNTSDIQQLQKDVKEVDKKSDLALGGVANAVAIANLVQVNSYSDYRHNLSAAYGYYGGSHALAIGFSGVTKDRRLVYKLSGSVNNKGNLAFGVGAGVMLGNKEESMEHKDINVKELYEKISKLEKENSEFREMFKKLGVMK